MKILITGSAGYIGSCTYEFFKFKTKYEIFCLDKNKPILKKQKNFYKINLLNYNKLKKFLHKIKPDIIIHLAGESTIDGIINKTKYYRNNVQATKNLVSISKFIKVKYFFFSSTASIYKSKKNKIKETDVIKPNNVYAKTKFICEKIVINEFQNSSTKFIVFRFFNACSSLYEFKIGEFHNPETHFLPILIDKTLGNKTFKIYGEYNLKTDIKRIDNTCVRDYVHIRDIIRAFKKGIFFLKENNSEIFNLGSGNGKSVLEIINQIKKMDLKVKYLYTHKRYGDEYHLVSNYSKAKKKLNWEPLSKLKKIIIDEINWRKFANKKYRKLKTIY